MDVDFLKIEKKRQKREPSWRGFILLLFLTITLLFAFGGVLLMSRAAQRKGGTIIGRLSRLLLSNDRLLAGAREDRINVLLLGVGGEGHEGGYLTDTIILASLVPSSGASSLLSIPRDLSVPITGNEWRKINSISAYAESVARDSGGEAARQAIEKLLAIPIPYYIRIDFKGFVQLIDDIGGVTVTVENRLEDFRYPIPGKEGAYPVEERYEHLVFEKGTMVMDGATALKYVRSRRGGGSEGSDFARVKRQQNVILAVKEKVFAWPTLTSPRRIARIVDNLATHIRTNIGWNEGLHMLQLLQKLNPESIRRIALSDAPEGLLAARIVNGAYILEPRDGTFAAIRNLAKNSINETPLEAPTKAKQAIRIAILNGTTTTGLAKTIGEILARQDFTITYVGNAPQRPVPQTTIYDMTNEKEFLAYDRLRLLLAAMPPDPTARITLPVFETAPDFVIILGENTKLP